LYTLYSFFQAEDGIRDRNVTGVQTCASDLKRHMPECLGLAEERQIVLGSAGSVGLPGPGVKQARLPQQIQRHVGQRDLVFKLRRSEERRVGNDTRKRRWQGKVEHREQS